MDTICPSLVVSRIASNVDSSPVTPRARHASHQNSGLALPGTRITIDFAIRTFVALEVGVDGSGGCGSTVPGHRVVVLSGPGPVEDS